MHNMAQCRKRRHKDYKNMAFLVLYGLRKGRMVLWENIRPPSFFLTDDYINLFFESVACFNNAHLFGSVINVSGMLS